jgi:hypothetical protein
MDQDARRAVEIDFRSSAGIDVSLRWHPRTNRLSISVSDSKTGDRFVIPVRPEDALDAFHHPYAYDALRCRHGGAAAA